MASMETTGDDAVPLETIIPTLAGLMSRTAHEGGLSSGELAELRRWRYGGTVPATAWRLLAQYVDSRAKLRPEGEERWFAVLSGMAHMAPHPHNKGFEAAPGRILAAHGYSENRFIKLIDSQDQAFFDAVARTCRYLRAKGVAMDWGRFAPLVLAQDPQRADHHRRLMARDYFSHKPQ
ncbi:MAG: type I-E CRISPR-associated protein Cse2/CasB [Magnetococcales bacterium]|nr:type I-E CRISPR-associated protein Cse2/CasB [Magnetococcales bacterium]